MIKGWKWQWIWRILIPVCHCDRKCWRVSICHLWQSTKRVSNYNKYHRRAVFFPVSVIISPHQKCVKFVSAQLLTCTAHSLNGAQIVYAFVALANRIGDNIINENDSKWRRNAIFVSSLLTVCLIWFDSIWSKIPRIMAFSCKYRNLPEQIFADNVFHSLSLTTFGRTVIWRGIFAIKRNCHFLRFNRWLLTKRTEIVEIA